MSSYLDKTGLQRVWDKANEKFITKQTTDALAGRIVTLEEESATKDEVDKAIADLVNSAPETLDTLNELAAALGDDPNFATTVTTEIGKKVNSSDYNDAIGSINSHISTINGEIDELQEASEQHLNKEDYLGPIIKEGNPIVYDNGVEGFDIKVETNFSPKQSGSGDPYPAGGGKNLLPNNATTKTLNGVTFTVNADGSLTMNGTATSDANFPIFGSGWSDISNKIDLDASETYILSDCTDGAIVYIRDAINDVNIATYSGYNVTFTDVPGITYAYIQVKAGTTVNNETIHPMIRLASDPDDSYAPYSNIRPFIGYDKLDLNHAGKNLIDKKSGLQAMNLPKGTVLFARQKNSSAAEMSLYGVDEAGSDVRIGTITHDNVCEFVLDRNFVGIAISESSVSVLGSDGQIIVSTTPIDSFQPYTNTLHTVQIGQTVYGGRMDWLTGKLVAEWAMLTLDGTEAWSLGESMYYRTWLGLTNYVTDKTAVVCSHFKGVKSNEYATNMASISGGTVTLRNDAAFGNPSTLTADDFKAYLAAQYAAGTPVQITYKLATPIEIQLTPTQISELEGINTLYGDGDSIRAIFKSTGGTSTTLETISGVLPVEKGGTGATSAAGARNNLGITPYNIGALSTAGGVASGSISAQRDDDQWISLHTARKFDGVLHEANLYTDPNVAAISFMQDGTWMNGLTLHKDYATLTKPLLINSGGTGATDAATARTNLGITPANIGAAPTSHASTATTYGVGSTTNYGHLKVGSNISVSSGTISLSKENITAALGYTPPTTDTNTHYTTRLYAGASGTAANAAATNPYLKITDDNTYRNQVRFVGSGATTVSSDANGNITISSTDTNTNTTYTFATGDSNGQIKVTPSGGSAQNISVKGLGSAAYKDASGSWGISVTGSSASCTGNAATATKLATSRALTIGKTGKNFDGSSNVSWSLREIGAMATDGSTYQVFLTGGDGNTSGYRLIGQSSIGEWHNIRLSFIVASRHAGNGLVTINYGCNSSDVSATNDYCHIKYFGISESASGVPIADNSFTARVSADGTTMYFFWYYNDYNSTYITVLGNNGAFVPSNGTWTTDPSTYGSLKASTQINVADSLSSTLAVNKGGTGITSNPSMLVNLGSTSAASVFAASPRPGITGTLPVTNGGTGATNKSGARTNLGITSGTSLPSSASAGDIFFLYS